MDIKRTDGVSVTSWRFQHGEERYLLSFAQAAGWMFSASDEDLKYNPVPTIEVRTARYEGGDYRTIERLDVPGADKRKGAPLATLEKVVQDYASSIGRPASAPSIEEKPNHA